MMTVIRKTPSISYLETLGKDAMKVYGPHVIRLEREYILAEDVYREDNTEENRQRVISARLARDEGMDLQEKLKSMRGYS